MPLINECYMGRRPELWDEQTDVTFTITAPPNEAAIPEPFIHGHIMENIEPMNREELSQLLSEGAVHVTFETADGEIKTILCTTYEPAIPTQAKPKTQSVSLRDVVSAPDPSALKIPKPIDPNLFKVYALDRQGWRSFRFERVKSYSKYII